MSYLCNSSKIRVTLIKVLSIKQITIVIAFLSKQALLASVLRMQQNSKKSIVLQSLLVQENSTKILHSVDSVFHQGQFSYHFLEDQSNLTTVHKLLMELKLKIMKRVRHRLKELYLKDRQTVESC